ncbi:hypothetical protein SERLA73DRAFT_187349 [Serpula lacrymans var. lacrymans S7.3]|uniref:Glycoside hydrolase family 76 protein n=2 Tax=Serpula lacrymans var. lacrymans TaxID=341189 RepID=F8Q905_SERL3|nr:uncharacterized protein SERLADRAFT_476832 [Serpula lacrymans var. lacrymans S7.9]EGN95060.1 hypothetical protein SERLA73DRAFT_187349 [Serpula lacrymans var. lacrymans S7.3]EGO20549.1 hypothetical protein SERLADRAFT_476832 [Serpula lacrymans var. lacrymans S7.9]
MANDDHVAGTTTNQAIVTQGLNQAFSDYSDYDQYGYNDDALWWATAAYYGYRAYGDQGLLNNAIATWQHVSNYVISAANAAAGSISTKSFAIEGSCGATMAGGVFWRPTSDDTSVNSVTTGLYMTLSAFLGEATGDSTYTTAAELSATWIQNVNLNSDYLALDTVDAQDCSRSAATELFTYNSGKLIEGVAVLAQSNSAWSGLLANAVSGATHTTAWQGNNGIITEGADVSADNDAVGFKSVLIRALHEAYTRNSGNSALQTLIQSYIDVQYNALANLASTNSGGTIWYSPAWAGPGPSSMISWGQLAALDVLVSVIDTNN